MATRISGFLAVLFLVSGLCQAQRPPPDADELLSEDSPLPSPEDTRRFHRHSRGFEDSSQRDHPTFDPVSCGFVILDGQDLEPPFAFAVKDAQIWLNGRAICPADDAEHPSPDVPLSDWRNLGETPLVASLRCTLLGDGLLVLLSGHEPYALEAEDTVDALMILTSGGSPSRQIGKLAKLVSTEATQVPWTTVIQTFRASPSLPQRLDTAASFRFLATGRGQVLRRLLLVSGLLLTIVALGSLVLLRPAPGSLPTSEVVSRTVLICVALLVALNLYDLVATLTTCVPGCLTELNPVAREMLRKPLLVGLGKMMVVAVGCWAIWSYRHQRVTIMAAWWLGMAYTVLVFHWTVCQYILLA